jgi:hypothetical protein
MSVIGTAATSLAIWVGHTQQHLDGAQQADV